MLANIAKAGQPFVTDDPEPPPAGGWEINIPFIIEHAVSGTEMNAPLFDLNYGLPKRGTTVSSASKDRRTERR